MKFGQVNACFGQVMFYLLYIHVQHRTHNFRNFRFHGDYNSVYGGQSGDAYLALTSGCSEYIDFDKDLEADAEGSKRTKTRQLHQRLKNACQSDAMLATEVPVSYALLATKIAAIYSTLATEVAAAVILC